MNWLMEIDTAILRFINLQWVHPLLDRGTPIFSHFDQ
jgi:hypothetical protein